MKCLARAAFVVAGILLTLPSQHADAQTLARVKQRGAVV